MLKKQLVQKISWTKRSSFHYLAAAPTYETRLSKTAYESACRPHEFLGLRKSDIAFDDYGAILYVRKGKTGARRIRVVEAAPLLANWIENHPLKDKDAPLWVDMSSNTKFRALKD